MCGSNARSSLAVAKQRVTRDCSLVFAWNFGMIACSESLTVGIGHDYQKACSEFVYVIKVCVALYLIALFMKLFVLTKNVLC